MSIATEKISKFDKFGSVLGLERVQELLKRLGNSHKNLKIIHVAGTNGKGSVSRFVYEVLKEEGYKVGIYSSPFLEVFNERIEFDGHYIPDDKLEEYADKAAEVAKSMCDEGLLSPTEFDVVTAIGFLYFAEMGADFVVLEVGLGGRGDSTNVIEKPIVTAITSISLDHTDRLGETIVEIAREKAGIIKEKVPMVAFIKDNFAKDAVWDIAIEKDAPYFDVTMATYDITKEDLSGSTFNYHLKHLDVPKVKAMEIQMIGKHQVENALVSLSILEVMKKRDIITLKESNLRKGMKKAVNKGRFEVMRENPYYILDGAHNEDGMKGFVNTVKTDLKGKKLLTVVGALKDKDIDKMVEILSELDSDFIATEPDNPRKLSKDDMKEAIRNTGRNVLGAYLPKDAFNKVTEIEKDYDAVLFVGSLYLIGELRGIINGNS